MAGATCDRIALVVIAAALACVAEARADSPARDATRPAGGDPSVCPPGASLLPGRTRAVLRLLRSRGQGQRLLAALARPIVVCYGDVPLGALQSDGVAVLQPGQPVAANVARLGHLLHHLVHGLPLDEETVRRSPQTCDALVGKADQAERAAHRLENDLRKAFRLVPLAFEDLSDAYRQRCEGLRDVPAGRSAM